MTSYDRLDWHLDSALAAGQLPNPAVTASARPFNASFTAANLFDTANAEYASLGQGAVSVCHGDDRRAHLRHIRIRKPRHDTN